MKRIFNNCTVDIIKGDITLMDTDAIVNAANEHLSHGGGVAGAIVRRGGYVIQQESNDWVAKNGLVKTGSAAITGAGGLRAKYVIHAVGPVMGSGHEDEKLRSATHFALELAESYHLTSIAFPAISTGIYGYPVDRCAKIMLQTVRAVVQPASSLTKIIFCLFDDKTLKAFENEIQALESML